ncbi:MAG: acyltransferase [Clostridia bacterium]|nr:acyltransferase [Clostridia bacterium]
MNAAVFFQKYGNKLPVKVLQKVYNMFLLRTNNQRVKFARNAGAKIGDNVTLPNVDMLGTEPCLVEIGDNVYFSGNQTQIITHDGGISWTYRMGIAPQKYDIFGKVKIGNNCFIGVRSIILKGVTIGDNCVIGAGSVVTKDIPAGSVACGVPAKVISTCVEYYEKNKGNFDDTIGWNTYKKRIYLQEKYK